MHVLLVVAGVYCVKHMPDVYVSSGPTHAAPDDSVHVATFPVTARECSPLDLIR